MFIVNFLISSKAEPSQKGSAAHRCIPGVFFIFAFFKKKFTGIYFWFQVLQFYTPTARQGGGRGPAAHLRGGRPPCRAVGAYM